jgi:hypothetical protein
MTRHEQRDSYTRRALQAHGIDLGRLLACRPIARRQA